MRTLSLSVPLLFVGLVACASHHPVAPDPAEDPPVDDVTTAPPRARPIPATFAAATDDGFAFLDTDGRVLSRVRTDARVHDLVVDGPGGRVLTFETDDEGEGGHVIERSIHAPSSPRTRAFVDGRARLAPVPSALVLFEDAYGPRWRLLLEDGAQRASLVAPMPSSAWTDGTRIHAFGREPDGWTIRTVDATSTGLVAIETRPVSGVVDETARAVGSRVIDLEGGRLVLRSEVGAVTTSVLADGIVDARGLREDLIAVVTSGPPRISVLTTDGALAASSEIDPVHAEPRLPARALAVVPAPPGEHRFLVATTQSVIVVRVTAIADGLALAPELRVEGVHAPASGPL